MLDQQSPLASLVQQFTKLPGIGEKSAQRLAFFVLSMPKKDVERFSEVMTDTRRRMKYCQYCFNLSYTDTCFICANPKRNQSQLCVVAEPRDIFALERSGEYKGIYHVLGGLISPIDGIQPEALRIYELLNRCKTMELNEIVIALNPTIEGDATGLYLHSLLKEYNVKISKLAYGLPVGSDIDYADEMTLQKALIGRTVLE